MPRANQPLAEYPLMIIEWIDSSRLGAGWIDFDEISDPTRTDAFGLGFLSKRTSEARYSCPPLPTWSIPKTATCTAGL
jgi:hypothetical protein